MAILKQKIQLTPDDTIVAIVAIVEKNKYESRWQQLSQLWQFWKILVTSIVAIMAILKTKKIYGSLFITIVAIMAILKTKNIIRIPFHHNCCNYGNSEKDTVDSWWQQLLQLWQLWKKQRWIPVTTIVAIMAILKNPGDINCRNYGNSEDKKIYGSLFITIFAIMAILKKIQLTPDDSNCCNCGNCGKNKCESRWQQLSQLWQFWKLLK